MSAIAQPARRGRTASTRARPRLRTRILLGGGVAWILLSGVLLGGVVALNVVVLKLNVQLDELDRERGELKADAARLRSHLSSASAKSRITQQAAARLGLVPADPLTTEYVPLTEATK